MNATRWSKPTDALINSGERERTTEITMLVSIYRDQVPSFQKKNFKNESYTEVQIISWVGMLVLLIKQQQINN